MLRPSSEAGTWNNGGTGVQVDHPDDCPYLILHHDVTRPMSKNVGTVVHTYDTRDRVALAARNAHGGCVQLQAAADHEVR